MVSLNIPGYKQEKITLIHLMLDFNGTYELLTVGFLLHPLKRYSATSAQQQSFCTVPALFPFP